MKSLKITIILTFLLSVSGIYQASAQWTTSGSNIYNTNSGNVGVGNSTPATLFHVGKSMTEPTIRIQNLGGTGGATFQMVDNVSGADWKFKATNAGGFKIRDNAFGVDVIQVEPNGITNSLYISAAGYVGLGTGTPAAKLDVKTTASYVAQFNGGAPMYMGLFESNIYRGYLGSYSGAAEDVDFGTGASNTTGKLHLTIQANPRLTINAAGDVGIGTTSPAAKLHITGGDLFVNSATGLIVFGYANQNQWQMATTGAGADLRWYTTTDGGTTVTPRHYFSQNGNVGIGGFSGPDIPIARLEVIGSGSTSSTNNFVVKNSTGDTLLRMRDDGRMGIGFNGGSYGRTMNLGGTGINFYTADNIFGGAVFPTDTSIVMWSNSGANNYLVLQPQWGNTGIGTYTPDAKLHVKGTVILGSQGTLLTNVIKAIVTKDITTVAANSSSVQSFTLNNATPGASVVISPENALPDGLIIAYARVSIEDNVEVKFTNVTGSAINPASMDFYITVIE
jgi:hypothetical protein